MNTLKIVRLKPKTKVVSLMAAVGRYSGVGLGDAKALIENVIGGEPVTLQFESEIKRTEFRALAESLGAVLD
ncbi:hypothetical protein [Roseimicrobium sp. ORNL1]|uniref:hypothetical protein n=1 Tax=Roseimicrobium sp. ORNL1 TaxID=2711231 RepID=UPI0013E12B9E|nr:hypothetical protein [Roseimicrobium sp. ORNL1]QIF01909.1 hypothetical protein G5S37_10340 [Roseimicrobium sp. ORNL1]